MPTYVMPPIMYNTACAFHERLPPSARVAFQTDFFRRLDVIPHPEQSADDRSANVEMSPTNSGAGHLDAIERWFFLGILVDEEVGVLTRAQSGDEAAFVVKVAALFRRWLDEDYPSYDEWSAIMDETKTPPPADGGNVYMFAMMSSDIGADSPTMVGAALDFAASSWWGAALPRPPIVSTSMIGRMFDQGLDWVARKTGRGESAGTEVRDHYLWQASLLLDLMNLRWLPTDPREEALFRKAIKNDRQAAADYAKMLRANKVDSAVVARAERTMQRMSAWYRLARTTANGRTS